MKPKHLAQILGIALTAAFCASASAQQLKMMTGPQGGSWYPLGGAIQGIIEKNVKGAKMQVLPGAGISNVKGVQAGKADLGFGNAVSSVDGVNGRAPFTSKTGNVCQVATLYFQYFHMVALADAGLEESIIDIMVAVSNPEYFAVDDRGQAMAEDRGSNTGYGDQIGRAHV